MGALSITTQNVAQVSRNTGNGGVGIVCRNAGRDIVRVEMLDIYEGRIHNLVFAAEPADINGRIGMTESRMSSNPSFLGQFQNELVRVRSGWMLLPSGTGLEYANETFPTFNRRGCSLEQVARYTDEGLFYVDQDLFSRMNELNKAALYLHAVIYRIARNQVQETSSVRTRRIVAHLLAQNGNSAVIAELMSQLAVSPAVPHSMDSWAGNWKDPRPLTPGVRSHCDISITPDRVHNQLFVVLLLADDRPCPNAGMTAIFRCDPSGDSCTNQSGNWRLRRIDRNSLLTNTGTGTHLVLQRY